MNDYEVGIYMSTYYVIPWISFFQQKINTDVIFLKERCPHDPAPHRDKPVDTFLWHIFSGFFFRVISFIFEFKAVVKLN